MQVATVLRRGCAGAVVAVAVLSLCAVTQPGAAPRATPPIRLVPGAISMPRLAASAPPTIASCKARSGGTVSCYDPAQLRVAYDLAPLYAKGIEGQHQTIVIVDCYGSPTIAADLAQFDASFGLPAPPSFKIIHPTGSIPKYSASGKDRTGWALETSLDVEWAHAIAPKASILLVETPTDEVEGTTGFPDIVAAEHYVITHKLGTVISQSFAATEETFASFSQVAALRSAYVAASTSRVTVLAGSGDLGATDYEDNASSIYPFKVTSWPATDPLVTSVGGTKLDLDKGGSQVAPAVAWNDTFLHGSPAPEASGGGYSEFFARPSYQSKLALPGTKRAVPDIAMSAACSGLVDVYVSFPGPAASPGWEPMCGTSEATPLFAGIVALSDQEAGHGLGPINPALYALEGVHGNGLVSVTSGNNTVSFVNASHKTVTVAGYDATSGYNLVTGLGTIDAASFVPALVHEWKVLAGT